MDAILDLHAISFSDLFYKVYESADPEATAMAIVNSIKPEAAAKYSDELVQVASENQRLEILLSDMRRMWEETENKLEVELSGMLEDYNSLLFINELTVVEYYLHEPDVEDGHGRVVKYDREAFLRWLTTLSRFDRTSDEIKDYLVDVTRVPKAFMKYCSENPIAVLLLFSRMKSDHGLIIFFAEKYHATFSGVDAYTGLHYAYEYFKKAKKSPASWKGKS